MQTVSNQIDVGAGIPFLNYVGSIPFAFYHSVTVTFSPTAKTCNNLDEFLTRPLVYFLELSYI